MKTVSTFFMLIIVTCVFTRTVDGQTISMQGVLRDPSGRSVEDAAYSITFKIYDVATGGAALWTETQANVQTSYGVFSVQLGAVNSLSSLGFDKMYFVGITVAGGTELSPRNEIIASPYSRAVLGTTNKVPMTGNSGFGTLSPTEKVDVAGNIKVTGDLKVNSGDVVLGAGGTGKLIFPDGSSFSTALVSGSASSVSNIADASITADGDANGSGSILFKTNGNNERMRVENSGNVGIGTTTPLGKLDVNGNFYTSIFYDREHTGYYVDPSATSSMNIIGVGTISSNVINSISINVTNAVAASAFYDRDNTSYYVDPSSTSILNDVRASIFYDRDNTAYYLNPGATSILSTVQAGSFVDNNNTSYFVDPDGWSTMGYIRLTGPTSSYTSTYGYLNSSGQVGTTSGQTNNYSLFCDSRVGATEFNAFSDKRIKNILGISNSLEDLSTLKKIKITDYKYVDEIGKGKNEYKKVIGQQVGEVFPQAVSMTTDFIPNVYEVSTSVLFNEEKKELTISTMKEHDFALGNTIRLIISKDEKETPQEFTVVSVSDNHTFSINYEQPLERVFVYGKQVDDFNVVDYEAIAMLNVSATQELAKQVEALQKENTALKIQLTKIETMEQELRALKAMYRENRGDNSLGMLTNPSVNDKK